MKHWVCSLFHCWSTWIFSLLNNSLDLWVYFKIYEKAWFWKIQNKYFSISYFNWRWGRKGRKNQKFSGYFENKKMEGTDNLPNANTFQVSHSSPSFFFFPLLFVLVLFVFGCRGFLFPWEIYSWLNAKNLSTTVYVSSQNFLPSPIPAAFEEFPRRFTFSPPFPQSTGIFLLPPLE